MKIACISSKLPNPSKLYEELKTKYAFYPLEEADVILCLGGDGFMLHVIHHVFKINKPIYGINCGTIGFLLNELNKKKPLENILSEAKPFHIHPLKINFTDTKGNNFEQLAFNEASFMRSSSVASHIKITIDKITRMERLVADGILVATPMGSTAYNMACGGRPISINSNMLCLTPINAFSPLNWKGAILNNYHIIDIENLNINNRKINLSCDFNEFKDIYTATIQMCYDYKVTLLFNSEDNIENKVIKTQFAHI